MVKAKSKGGRPQKTEIAKLDAKILTVASGLFLKNGYGATSIEAVAKSAGISKRTLYHRYSDKSELFGAVMHRLIENMRPSQAEDLFEAGDLREVLARLAKIILQAALSKEALALHKLLVAEAVRFPVLAKILGSEGRRMEAVERISNLLENEIRAGNAKIANTEFAAEQFLQMLISHPQNRALGLGTAMSDDEVSMWITNTIEFFLKACVA